MLFFAQTAQNGIFFVSHGIIFFSHRYLLFLTEPEVFEPKAIKHSENTKLTLRVPFGYFSLPQITQITQIFLSHFF